jgi:toxin-antitoxin system PIN domain toxin
MIAVDTNLLIYAHREDTDFHSRAKEVLKDLAEGSRRWSIPWNCLHEFLAITTHSRIFNPPSPGDLALRAIDVWLDSPSCEMLAEGPGYYEVLTKFVTKSRITGPMIHDARIAALCINSGVQELWTADRDFSRFPQLKTRNPLLTT